MCPRPIIHTWLERACQVSGLISCVVFLPKDIRVATEAEVASIGAEVITDEVFDWVTDSERNTPYLKGSGRDAFGRWNGELVTGEGWRQLQKFGIAKGYSFF